MKKIISLITALALCLSLCPPWALAADMGGPGAPEAGAYEVGLDAAAAPVQRVRAGGPAINMDYDGFVFANGIPIVIRENNGITSIYHAESGELLSGGTDVTNRAIYGGWYDNSTHNASTSIVMESGTITAAIFGGCYSATLNGNTSVVLSGGTVGWVYGGGNGSVTNGTASVTVNPGAKVWGQKASDPSAAVKGTVYGGGYGGSTKSTEVVFNGGDIGWLYGGGQSSVCGNTHVVFVGQADDYAEIYGGGYDGSADAAILEIQGNTCSANSKTLSFCGNGWNDTVQKVEIRIGSSSQADAAVFYANNPFDDSSAVNTASFDVTLSSDGPYIIPQISALDGSGVTGKVSVRFHGRGEADQDYRTRLIEVDEVVVEDSRIVFGEVGSDGRSAIKLDRLEVAATGEAVFPDSNVEAAIGELAGSGTIWFTKERPDTTLTPVTVNRISAADTAPLKIGGRGPYMTNDLWKSAVLFQGSGVEALTDASSFASTDPKLVPAKTDDGKGIRMKDADTRVQAYITPPHFDKSSYAYGDAMTITLGLTANNLPVSGASLEIRGGSQGLRTIATVLLDANGEAEVSLPVDDILWDSRETGLQAMYWGSEQYLSNFYGISLKDSPSSMDYLVTPAEIELPGELPAPALGAEPVENLPVGEDAFYTAQVIWTPAHAAFQLNTAYTAHIRLVPKEGYSLDPEKIGSVSFQGRELTIPAALEPDGSLLLSNAAVFPAIPGFQVDLTASPAEGGTVTGDGLYAAGSQVTVSAVPAEGYVFQRWMEDGAEASASPEYTFLLTAHRRLTAVFHTHAWGPWTEDGAAQHSRVCEGCGAVERGDHEYDGDTDAVCNVCGYERTILSDEKTKIEQGELTEVPEGLKDTDFNTVDRIKSELSRVLISQTGGYTGESVAFYDVSLLVSVNGGPWEPATKENFPEGGLTITLPYPEGTGRDTHDFLVTHMFTTSDFGNTPGHTEQPPVTKTAEGLQVTLRGLSPIAVAWKAVAAPEPPVVPDPPEQPSRPGWTYSPGWTGGYTVPAAPVYTVTVEAAANGAVTASRRAAARGDTVVLTAVPEEGYALETLTAVDSQGGALSLTEKDGGKYVFTMPGRAVTVSAVFASLPPAPWVNPYPDVAENAWYADAVRFVQESGLMSGDERGNFGPDRPLSRAQLAQILFNKEGRPAGAEAGAFTDVAEGAWYADAVNWAAARGVVNGLGGGIFGPNGSITREQLAVMLWRYAGSPAATDRELHFADAGEASPWALEALLWAAERGILSGADGRLDPAGPATRAQAAQMLKNLLEE